jgi:DNA modification methylase
MSRFLLCQGDARALPFADKSVHCCVTSPPYFGLRDYGVAGQLGLEQAPDAYVAGMVAVFREVWRVLRDDGTCWINIGDSYASASACSRRNVIGNGSPDADTQRPNRLTGDLKEKDLIGIPWMLAFALRADGWYLRSDIIWSKPNPMPESVTDRPTKAHEYLFLLSKRERYYYDAEAIAETSSTNDPRRPYTSNGAKALDGRAEWKSGQPRDGVDFSTRNRRSVWTVTTSPFPEAHFATYPPALIEPCILAGSPVGGTVLDPFTGSGTTGEVAIRHGRNFVGVELNSDYITIAKKRIANAPLSLFGGAA